MRVFYTSYGGSPNGTILLPFLDQNKAGGFTHTEKHTLTRPIPIQHQEFTFCRGGKSNANQALFEAVEFLSRRAFKVTLHYASRQSSLRSIRPTYVSYIVIICSVKFRSTETRH